MEKVRIALFDEFATRPRKIAYAEAWSTINNPDGRGGFTICLEKKDRTGYFQIQITKAMAMRLLKGQI